MSEDDFKKLIKPILYKNGSGWLLDNPKMLIDICKKYCSINMKIDVSKKPDQYLDENFNTLGGNKKLRNAGNKTAIKSVEIYTAGYKQAIKDLKTFKK